MHSVESIHEILILCHETHLIMLINALMGRRYSIFLLLSPTH